MPLILGDCEARRWSGRRTDRPHRGWHASPQAPADRGTRGYPDAIRRPVRIVPTGVDTDYFQPGPERGAGNPFRVLFVGRFQKQKNLLFLLEQFAAMVQRLPTIEISLDLIGDGPLRQEIEAKVVALGLTERVQLRGWLRGTQLLAAYQGADCVVNPSLYEGMPNVVLEAMACAVQLSIS